MAAQQGEIVHKIQFYLGLGLILISVAFLITVVLLGVFRARDGDTDSLNLVWTVFGPVMAVIMVSVGLIMGSIGPKRVVKSQ